LVDIIYSQIVFFYEPKFDAIFYLFVAILFLLYSSNIKFKDQAVFALSFVVINFLVVQLFVKIFYGSRFPYIDSVFIAAFASFIILLISLIHFNTKFQPKETIFIFLVMGVSLVPTIYVIFHLLDSLAIISPTDPNIAL